jgi:anti-sigma regulatory factor (Ser/Thr protein kinase)
MLREHLRAWLEEAGASESEVFDVVLASVEVVTNARDHPKEPTSNLVEFYGTISKQALVTISIRDYGTWLNGNVLNEGGLGLVIVEAVMDSFQVDTSETGTVVTMHRQLDLAA